MLALPASNDNQIRAVLWPGSASARWGKAPPGPPFFGVLMYLLYLDSSGKPADPNVQHFVQAGLCVPERGWFALEKRLQGLKRKYQHQNIELEIHVRQFARTISEQDAVTGFDAMSWDDRRAAVQAIQNAKLATQTNSTDRRALKKKYKETNPYIHLTRLQRSCLLEDAIDLIASHNGVRLFAEAINLQHPQILNGSSNPITQSFEQVVARFNTFLQKRDGHNADTNPRRFIHHGLLILDQDASTESTIEMLFKQFRRQGHSFGGMTHVIDVPFFAASSKVSGLQLVDVCAYAIRRYLDKGAAPGSHEERQFQKLFPRFDRDSGGTLHGIRHYVTQGQCNCMICQSRGHATPATF